MCIDCWTIVDRFHDFHENVQRAQANFLSNLIKTEPENHFVDVPESIDFVAVDPTVSDSIDSLILLNEGQNKTKVKIEYDMTENASSLTIVDEQSEHITSIEAELSDHGETFEDDNYEIKSHEPAEYEELIGFWTIHIEHLSISSKNI